VSLNLNVLAAIIALASFKFWETDYEPLMNEAAVVFSSN
jgi:hypothetical protein